MMNTTVINPDYPIAGMCGSLSQFQYQDPNANSQFFYGGYGSYGNGFPSVNDPNSRINQNSFNYATPYQNQQNGYGYGQPQHQTQQAVTPVQPFSTYGGSGNNNQPIMPTLNTPVFNQPQQVAAPVQQQPLPTFSQPTYYQNPVAPLFNAQIPSFDTRTECWGNQYVQPQQIPVPQIDWNKPVQQPMANPMCPFQNSCPTFSQGPQTFQDNWMDSYKRNFNM